MDNATELRSATGLLISSDLIFATKITGTARALGSDFRVVASPDAALAAIEPNRTRCILLDLGLASLTADWIRQIVAAAGGAAVIAFGSHVDTDRLQEAAEAGCNEVMPRSRLSATLPQILAQFLHVE